MLHKVHQHCGLRSLRIEDLLFLNAPVNACDLGRGNHLWSCLLKSLLSYLISCNKMSNEGRKQNKIFVYVNSVAECGNVYRSSGSQADLSILSNTSHSEQEGVEQNRGFAQSALQPVHGGCSCSLGTKWNGRSISSRCWPKPMLWLQNSYDYVFMQIQSRLVHLQRTEAFIQLLNVMGTSQRGVLFVNSHSDSHLKISQNLPDAI